jgi:hypothetical protein
MNKMRKSLLLTFIIVAILTNRCLSQSKGKTEPFLVRPGFGIALTSVDKKVFPGQKSLPVLNPSLTLSKGITNKLGLSFTFDYRKFNIMDAALPRYDFIRTVDNNFVQVSGASTLMNGILSVGYHAKSKSGKHLLEVALGGGAQSLKNDNNVLAFNNPYNHGMLDTVFSNGGASTGFVGQIGLHYTYFPFCYIGITLGVRTQYNANYSDVQYSSMKKGEQGSLTYEEYCSRNTTYGSYGKGITILPEVGISIRFCRKRPLRHSQGLRRTLE